MTNRRPSRFRRVAKWVGLGVCVVIVGIGLANTWWIFGYSQPMDDSCWGFLFNGGCFEFRTTDFCGDERFVRWNVQLAQANVTESGWRVRYAWDVWMLSRYFWQLPFTQKSSHGGITLTQSTVPLWVPFAAIIIPTTILWSRDRRPPKGYCPHCGYNLTGNESGVCPECATPVPKQETTA